MAITTKSTEEALPNETCASVMEFGDFKATEFLNPNYKRIRELGLEQSIVDLEVYGFTVIPPEKVAPPEFLERIRDTVLRIARERTGVELKVDENGSRGKYEGQPQTSGQFLLYNLLLADRIFEEWLMNPTLYTIGTHLMHGQQQLSSLTSFIKWKGGTYGDGLGLHSDAPPDRDGRLSPCSDISNAAYCLTDYTEANGTLAMVPGSHRLCRQPMPGEGVEDSVPVVAPAGSLIAWHGNTWHGAYPKVTDGLRMNLTTYMCHKRIKTQEHRRNITQEMLDRNTPEFARLVGADEWMGFDEKGPDYAPMMKYGGPEVKKRMAARAAARGKAAADQ